MESADNFLFNQSDVKQLKSALNLKKEIKMNNMQKAGGYAALVTGVQFLAILVIQFVVLAPLGIAGPGTSPDKVLAVAANSTTPFLVQFLITGLFSITLLLGALAVRERLQAGAPNRMRLAVIAASIGSALFLAYGITSFTGFSSIVAANDASAFRAVDTVENGLIVSAIFAFGWVALLWGSAGLSTKGLPTGLNYVLLVAGVIAVLAFIIPIFGLLGVVINVIWAFWLGYVLLQPAPMMSTMGGNKS